MKPTWCVGVLAAAFHSRWLRGNSLLLTDDHVINAADESERIEPSETGPTDVTDERESDPSDRASDLMKATSPDAEKGPMAETGPMDEIIARDQAKSYAEEAYPMNATNATSATDAMEETPTTPTPMDGSAVQHPPPQFVLDFCGPQAEQMLGDANTIGCYGWVVQMHSCYTSCKQTADINTLEANVGGCLQAMCGFVPALICGPRDGGGICSLDSDPEGSVEHCDKMCNHFSECVIFQTKGASPPNFPSGCATDGTTAALFEQCYDQCIGEDELSWSPTAEPTVPEGGAPGP